MKGRVNNVDRIIKEEMDIDRRNVVVVVGVVVVWGLVFNVVIHGRCFIVDCVDEMRVYFLVLNILGKTLNKYNIIIYY